MQDALARIKVEVLAPEGISEPDDEDGDEHAAS
jgi:hypothetical protein